MKLKIGDKAPDFELLDQNGQSFTLSEAYSNQKLVVFFYPKAHTPGCTREACSFRDSYEVFQEAGADVIGISTGTEESHKKFGEKNRLPYTLLNDADQSVQKLYGVKKTLGLFPGRVTFVIDSKGIILHIYDSQLNFHGHIEQALEALK